MIANIAPSTGKKLIFCILLLTLLVLAQGMVSAQQLELPTEMPEWQLQTQNGLQVSSQDYAGQPLVLHFWSTDCPYCKRLQPGLDELAQDYATEGLQILAISLNEVQGAKPQDELIARGLQLKTLVEGESLGFDNFKIFGTPTTIFVAPDGAILGSTMQSDPNDPQWRAVANYLVSLSPRELGHSDVETKFE